MDDYAASFLGLQRAFVGAVLRGAPIPQPARDNLATLRATFAAYASAEQGRFVALEEIRP
jgi:predicted dehydrogenase